MNRNGPGDSPPAAVRVIDSHTAGEPSRVVVEGVPDLGDGVMASRRNVLRERFDWLRTSLVTEPRGSEWMVGAVLQPPTSADCIAGVIFFNNVGYLGMCGHGAMGVVATLSYLGRIGPGVHRLETPVGEVAANMAEDGRISIDNVPCYRTRKDVSIVVPGYGEVTGDVAWGGNWFFLAAVDGPVLQSPLDELTRLTTQIRSALVEHGVAGEDGAEIDHIELVGPPSNSARADARGFVLCPGGHYDRSPCGTGTSAKLACLAADGKLLPGQLWRQESIIGSLFEARYRRADRNGVVIPTITGRAFVNADLRLVINPDDPYCFGIEAQ